MSPVDVAADFLQTVVVVDDQAYASNQVLEAEVASLGGETIALDSDAVVAPVAEQPDPEEFDAEVVVKGFADRGITCAVLAPEEDDPTRSRARLVKLAARSDVVVLDWYLRELAPSETSGPSRPRTSIDLLAALVEEDIRTGSRLRLVCIYTGSSNFAGVLDQVEERIRELLPGVVRDGDKHRLDAGDTRIVVAGKDRPVPIPGLTIVSATDLPQFIVGQFAEFAAGGMLRRLAMASLSAVRDRSHRLLRRFALDLDPAFLSHRAFTSAQDAESFASELVADEVGAMLSAERVGQLFDTSVIEAAVESYLGPREEFTYWQGIQADAAKKQLNAIEARAALLAGVDSNDRYKIRGTNRELKNGRRVSLVSLMLDTPEVELRNAARLVDLRFSAVSSLDRDMMYDGQGLSRPDLRIGALVRQDIVESDQPPSQESDQEPSPPPRPTTYWLCVQPACDSVRLAKRTRFPFLPLSECNDNSESFDVVAYDGGYVPLRLSYKFNAVTMFEFEPDLSVGSVLADWNTDRWAYAAADGHEMTWLGQMRPSKAHALLTMVVNSAGRVGLNEYDYLRRMSSTNQT